MVLLLSIKSEKVILKLIKEDTRKTRSLMHMVNQLDIKDHGSHPKYLKILINFFLYILKIYN